MLTSINRHFLLENAIQLKPLISVSGTVGPMTRDFDGLVFSTKAILNDHHFQLDPKVPPLRFRDEVSIHLLLILNM